LEHVAGVHQYHRALIGGSRGPQVGNVPSKNRQAFERAVQVIGAN